MSFVCLGPRQTDFSWVAFLDHLQTLACNYGCLRPVSPLLTVQELVLDCVADPDTGMGLRCRHDVKMSLARLFPNVKRLRLNSIPDDYRYDEDCEQVELCFFKDIQLMTLQLVALYNYPYGRVPILTQNPEWTRLDVTINPQMNDHEPIYEIERVPASSADLLTSLTLCSLDTEKIDLSVFSSCSRLEHLTFQLWDETDSEILGDVGPETIQLVNLRSLTKACHTLEFQDFVPYVHSVKLRGWLWHEGRPHAVGKGKGMWARAVRVK